MDVSQATGILWEEFQQGRYYPQQLQNALDLETGYKVQMAMQQRWIAAGQHQMGWKLAFTADMPRKKFGTETLGLGYLLEKGRAASGHSYSCNSMTNPALEVELAVKMKADLEGKGVTAEQVAESVASLAPCFEVMEKRGDMAADLNLGIADNIFQYGVALGQEVSPPPADLVLGEITAEISNHGQITQTVRSGDAIDNQYESIAWLAGRLADFGRKIEAGQTIITGSFVAPFDVAPGDQWEAKLSGLGSVTVQFT